MEYSRENIFFLETKMNQQFFSLKRNGINVLVFSQFAKLS